MNSLQEIERSSAVTVEEGETLAATTPNQGLPKQCDMDATSPPLTDQVANDPSSGAVPSAPESGEDILAKRKPTVVENLEDWECPFVMSDVANDMAATIRKHCILSPAEIDAIVLWSIASYAIEAVRIFPRLALISPEKRCGKSTTMELIAAMCRNGLQTGNMTPATIFRLSTAFDVTLLIDEADTFVKNGSPELIGIINSSHCKSTATVLRCVGDDNQPTAFRTWLPIVLASICPLASTIMDRSIVINLRRKKNSEHVARILGNLKEQLLPTRRMIATWCRSMFLTLEQNPVEPPANSNDRAVDNWLPLFTIAHHIGGGWPERCDAAYAELETADEPTTAAQLLRDIRELLSSTNAERVSSTEIVEWLCREPDSPWLEINKGGRVTPTLVASTLRPFGIRAKTMRWDDKTLRGYQAAQFTDAFERYL